MAGPYLLEDTVKGAAGKPINGLHDAQRGDIVEIGFSGYRHKSIMKITDVVGKDRLKTSDGSLFDRSGFIYRKGTELKYRAPEDTKIIFAKHVTQKQLDDELRNRKIEVLKVIEWNKLSDEQLDNVFKCLPTRWSISTMQGGWKSYE
jgi:hypothetical protein